MGAVGDDGDGLGGACGVAAERGAEREEEKAWVEVG
jgi:hypothetical protein